MTQSNTISQEFVPDELLTTDRICGISILKTGTTESEVLQ